MCLDPFLGSGTTGVAATLEGFDFYGIEEDAESFRISEARILLRAESMKESRQSADGET